MRDLARVRCAYVSLCDTLTVGQRFHQGLLNKIVGIAAVSMKPARESIEGRYELDNRRLLTVADNPHTGLSLKSNVSRDNVPEFR